MNNHSIAYFEILDVLAKLLDVARYLVAEDWWCDVFSVHLLNVRAANPA
jgi:hypothetical protein